MRGTFWPLHTWGSYDNDVASSLRNYTSYESIRIMYFTMQVSTHISSEGGVYYKYLIELDWRLQDLQADISSLEGSRLQVDVLS